jgi:manganese transport protein
MGTDANHRLTTVAGWAIGVLISLLNVLLIYLTVSGKGST